MTADKADRAWPKRKKTGENDKIRYHVTWSPAASSDDREKAFEALKEFVRALARHQARLDLEEGQRARREAISERQEKVADKNLFSD